MILDFDSTYIEIIRGDTISLKLNLNSGTRECPVYSGMPANSQIEIYIIPPNEPVDSAVIAKVLTSDDVGVGNVPTLCLSSEESSILDLGKYYLTIKMLQEDISDIILSSSDGYQLADIDGMYLTVDDGLEPLSIDSHSATGDVDEVLVVTTTLVNNKQVFVTGIPSAGGVY